MTRRTRERRAGVAGRILLVAAAAALAWTPSPAVAAPPSGAFSGPAEGAVLRSGPPQISGEYTQPNGIVTRVNLALRSLGGRGAPGAALEVPGNGGGSLPFTWAPALAYNGPYEVAATGTGEERPVDPNGAETSAPIARRFSMEVPPVAPTDVRASVDKATRYVRVSWRVNPEPDMVGYQVQRSRNSGPFASVGETSSTSLTDESTAEEGGDYRYRVVALRLGATDQNVITSGFSAQASASVAAPPTTTTSTTPSEGGSGGGDGGGTTNTTAPGSANNTSGRNGRTAPVSGNSRLDLSAFASLLDQNRNVPQPEEADEGFDPTLPFAPPTDAEEAEEPEFEERRIPIQQALTEEGTADRFKNLAILAGGLLAFVVAMNLIYVLGEAHRAMEGEALPALAPDPALDEPTAESMTPSADDLALAGAAATIPELLQRPADPSIAPEAPDAGEDEDEHAATESAAAAEAGAAEPEDESAAEEPTATPRRPTRRDRIRAYVFGAAAVPASDEDLAPDLAGEHGAPPAAAEAAAYEAEAEEATDVDRPWRPRPGSTGSVLAHPRTAVPDDDGDEALVAVGASSPERPRRVRGEHARR